MSSVSLPDTWNELLKNYRVSPELAVKYWQEIESHYTRKGRHYHDLSHLAYMLNWTTKCRDHLEAFPLVQFSTFYHDIIYDAKRQDNEARSADLARERLTALGLPQKEVEVCCAQIMATQGHEATVDQDTCYLLDIDLGILGESPAHYLNYTQCIRKEYAMFPNFMYKRGRKKVLKHFLAMDHIYKTELFRSSHGPQARKNLTSELDQLS